MSNRLDKIKRLLRRRPPPLEEIVEGAAPAATPPAGAASRRLGDRDRETSTNAQTAGAADAPWGGNS